MLKGVEEGKNTSNLNKKVSFSDIVISINNNGCITKLNEEGERVTGYSKYESLNKTFLDFLIPDRYSKQWKKIFDSIKKNKLIDDFKLPLLTRNGHEIMISWSSFPTTNGQGNIADISLVGRFISSWNDLEESNIGQVKKSPVVYNENEDFFKIFKELEKKNQELEKLNLDLEKKLKKIKSKKSKKSIIDGSAPNSHRFSIGFGKKKKEEIENIYKELDERKALLDAREAELNEEQRVIEEKKNWFIKWREKLENLELEIDNRARDLNIRQQNSTQYEVKSEGKLGVEDYEKKIDLLDEIDECAVVIQRGILKQANESFAKLLGYNIDEIVEKSLFDFICPEGFPGLEEYYLGRLKGDDVSVYETIFLTKDNNKIAVEVSTMPATFNNDKAEIAVFKKVDKKTKLN